MKLGLISSDVTVYKSWPPLQMFRKLILNLGKYVFNIGILFGVVSVGFRDDTGVRDITQKENVTKQSAKLM